jgi:hypothetical protein
LLQLQLWLRNEKHKGKKMKKTTMTMAMAAVFMMMTGCDNPQGEFYALFNNPKDIMKQNIEEQFKKAQPWIFEKYGCTYNIAVTHKEYPYYEGNYMVTCAPKQIDEKLSTRDYMGKWEMTMYDGSYQYKWTRFFDRNHPEDLLGQILNETLGGGK